MTKVPHYALKQRQGMPLSCKIIMTKRRIENWYIHWKGKVYVAFSGGKDSTVLLHLVRSLHPRVPAVFVDTGLEYPEIREFVKGIDNVVWLKPKMNFKQVIEKYGYPVVSKEQSCAISRYRKTKDPVQKYRRLNGWPNGKKGMISKKWQYLIDAPFKISDKCCDVMKKNPLNEYAKETQSQPIIGIMCAESNSRARHYLDTGCNAFDLHQPKSMPLSFWTEDNIWEYIRLMDVPYSQIYDMGETRTGCMFCMFGCHREQEPNRFQRMHDSHPKQYDYCMNKLGLKEVLEYMKIPHEQPKLEPLLALMGETLTTK